MSNGSKFALTPEILAASRVEPEFYFRQVLGIDRVAGEYVIDLANSVRDNRETRVAAGRGVAKSHTLGLLASWWFDCWSSSAVFLTGTVYRQVRNAYNECRKSRAGAPFELPGRVLETGIVSELDPKWKVVPFAAKNADAALGGHADYVLVLVDEASGMDKRVCESLYGCLSGPDDRIVWSGNPLHVSGHFADLARMDHVANHTISVKQTVNYIEGENVIRGVAGREFVDHVAQTYGEDSDVYRVHVLGLPPREGGNSLFSLAGLADARARGETAGGLGEPGGLVHEASIEPAPSVHQRTVAGLDLARLGDDRCALITLTNGVLTDIEKWGGRTLDFTLDRARSWLNQHGPDGLLLIDATSEGTFSDVLVREFPGRVRGVNFGGAPVLGRHLPRPNAKTKPKPLYQNRRAEMWYEAAKWTASKGAWSPDVPADKLAELEVDLLSAVRVDPTPSGAMRVEKKEVARKRIGRSPDLGDAYCLAVSGLLTAEYVPRGSVPAKVPAERVPYRHRTGRPMVGAGGRRRHR